LEPNLKTSEFTIYKFKNLKNQKKYYKKLEQILSVLVKKLFQISIV
jgi:hypothetical protein